MTDFVLGINTCFAVKRWPRPDEWTDIVGALGVSNVQFSLDLLPLGMPKEAAHEYLGETAATARSRGIAIDGVFTGLAAYGSNLMLSESAEERDWAESWYVLMVDFARTLGAPSAGGHLGALSVAAHRNANTREQLITDLRRRLLRIAEHAARAGLSHLLFENLAVEREWGHSIAEAQRIERSLSESDVPWILCLDLGHPAAVASAPSHPLDWLDVDWAHTPILQLQQSPPGVDMHGPFTAEKNRNGVVDRDAVLTALARWEVPEIRMYLEVIPAHEANDDQVLRDLMASVSYWKTAIDNTT